MVSQVTLLRGVNRAIPYLGLTQDCHGIPGIQGNFAKGGSPAIPFLGLAGMVMVSQVSRVTLPKGIAQLYPFWDSLGWSWYPR